MLEAPPHRKGRGHGGEEAGYQDLEEGEGGGEYNTLGEIGGGAKKAVRRHAYEPAAAKKQGENEYSSLHHK